MNNATLINGAVGGDPNVRRAIACDSNGNLLMGTAQAAAVSFLPSAGRTTTTVGADTANTGFSSIRISVDVTTAGTGSITVSVQGKDANNVYYVLASGGPYTTQATNVITATGVPAIFRINVVHNNANAIIYSVGYQLYN